MPKFCIHESHAGVCEKTGSYCNEGVCPYEDMRDFAEVVHGRWIDIVDAAPTVDAEVVVRCKDCVHYDMGVCLKIYSDGNVHPEAWQPRRPEDYCSHGERKEE